MRFELPSRGKFGLTSINMRSPKIEDLRHTSDLSDKDELAKDQFLQRLFDNPDDLDKISIFDRDYLFLLSVSNVQLNKLAFKAKCDCGFEISDSLDISNIVVKELEDDVSVEKDFFGNTYKFSLYNVAQEKKIIDYAMLDDDTYNDRFQDAQVCTVLGKEPNDDNIKWVKDLDLAVYFAALFYIQCGFHGVQPIKVVTCPKCGSQIAVIIPVVKELMQFDTLTVMSKFAEVSGSMDFKSFTDMSIPEYASLINELNKQQ